MPKTKPTQPEPEPEVDVNDLKTTITIYVEEEVFTRIERAGHLAPDHIARIAGTAGMGSEATVEWDGEAPSGVLRTGRGEVASFTWEYLP